MEQVIFIVTVKRNQWLVKSNPRGFFYKSANSKIWERLTQDRFECAVEQATELRIQRGNLIVATYKLVPVKK